MINDLYTKYKAEHHKDKQGLNPLSFILRKAELSKNLSVAEWQWLDQHQLVDTKAVIKDQEEYRDSLLKELRSEFFQLKQTPLISIDTMPSVDSEIHLILYKVNTQERLVPSEFRLVGSRYHKSLDFRDKKSKLGITEDIPFNNIWENIVSKLENKTPLSAVDIQWLGDSNVYSSLNVLKKQFFRLQKKYKAFFLGGVNDDDLLSLFCMLQKLDENSLLGEEEVQYLKKHEFTEILDIIQLREFVLFKKRYKATKIEDNSLTHHLFKVLKKMDSGLSLTESDINYLKKRKLIETVKFIYKKEADSLTQKISQGHGLRPDDITWCEEHNFEEVILKWLKNEYGVKFYNNKQDSPLYSTLRKLEAGHRLSDNDVVWLESEQLLRRPSKIFTAHHTLEALYYENEFQRLKDHWKLASGSAHWRKADEPQKALSLTDNLNYKKIKPAKLRAALFTTRGGAFRDMNALDDAEECALEAIKHFPDSHNPYTLMGALYYDSGEYVKGDKWFEEAIKRGAKPHDQDSEIKRILRKKSTPELVEHLLKKDPKRFSWVKSFSRGAANRKNQPRKKS